MNTLRIKEGCNVNVAISFDMNRQATFAREVVSKTVTLNEQEQFRILSYKHQKREFDNPHETEILIEKDQNLLWITYDSKTMELV